MFTEMFDLEYFKTYFLLLSGCKDTVGANTRWSCQTSNNDAATTSTTTSIAATTQTTDAIRPGKRRVPDATGTMTSETQLIYMSYNSIF